MINFEKKKQGRDNGFLCDFWVLFFTTLMGFSYLRAEKYQAGKYGIETALAQARSDSSLLGDKKKQQLSFIAWPRYLSGKPVRICAS